MALDVGFDVTGRAGNGITNAPKYLADAGRGATHPGLAQSLQLLGAWPFRRAVESERHAVFRQVDRCRYKIVDGGEPRFALYIVVDNAEILQMRITIAQCAIDDDERK